MSNDAWNTHYTRDKSVLLYPDENLVRMLKPYCQGHDPAAMRALDLGCGTGRHLKLLYEMGVQFAAGIDTSPNALASCPRIPGGALMLADALQTPLQNETFDIVIAWGSLHYTVKDNLGVMLSEIHRVMKKGGRLFGTLRSTRDTYLKRGTHVGNDTWITTAPDIRHSTVSFYSEAELRSALGIFSDSRYGIMERSLTGDIEKIISHWFFWAKK